MPELLRALTERRAQRAFAPEPVSDELLGLLWQAVSLAPSHGNTQPTRILVPATAEQRKALDDALSEGNRGWATAAPVLAALASIPEHSKPAENRDGTLRELWAFNSGIALGNLMAQGTELGLIAHPMAGFDEPSVRAVFDVPKDVRILAVIAIGYPGDPSTLPQDLREKETAPRQRLPLDRLVVRGQWTEQHGESARGPGKRRG